MVTSLGIRFCVSQSVLLTGRAILYLCIDKGYSKGVVFLKGFYLNR